MRFSLLLNPCKKVGNKNIQKSGAFWDPSPLLRNLASVPFTTLQHNLSQSRLRLMLVCRLLMLLRPSDSLEMKRFASLLGSTACLKIRRNRKISKLERVVSLTPPQDKTSRVYIQRKFQDPQGVYYWGGGGYIRSGE